MSFNKKKTFLTGLKFIIAILACWYIYQKVFQHQSFEDIVNYYQHVLTSKNIIFYLMILLFLMICNWSLEALKWQVLLQKVSPITFFKSLLSVFAGVAVGIFTPNRIGEYGGRIFFIKEHRIKAGLATIIGSFSQLIITLSVGTLTLPFFFLFYQNQLILDSYLIYMLFSIAILLTTILLFIFLNINTFTPILLKINYLKKYEDYLNVFSTYQFKDLFTLVMLSFIRYCVFTLQFILLLNLFDVMLYWIHALIAIPVIFLAIAAVPTIAPVEVGVREFFSLEIIGLMSENSIAIIGATLSLWIINISIPALVGVIGLILSKSTR